MRRRVHTRARGLTLLEVMVSVAILAVIATLIFGAFDGMRRSREGISRVGDRYHEGRTAIARMSREISTAFISLHRPVDTRLLVRQTLFIGTTKGSVDRVDFTSFSHRRTGRDTRESDQNELSYFGSADPSSRAIDLARRESANIDEDARRGGVVQVLARDVDSLDLSYLDGISGEWSEEWDSTQSLGQTERLPAQVRIALALNRGLGEEPLMFVTKVSLGMQSPIGLAQAGLGLGGLGDVGDSGGLGSAGNAGSGSPLGGSPLTGGAKNPLSGMGGKTRTPAGGGR